MSETPRTDALIDEGKITTGDVANAMRKLERDLRKCEVGATAMRDAFESHRCGCQNQELRDALAAWQEANK